MTERTIPNGRRLSLVRETSEPGDDLCIAGPELVEWQVHVQILQIGSCVVALDPTTRELLGRDFTSLCRELSRPVVSRTAAAEALERICDALTAPESTSSSVVEVIEAGRSRGFGRVACPTVRTTSP